MKLLCLNIHGFKSFKDKTTIHFDDGITGIVGPNGCGKSNIVDALFWVMGEQSAKHLRGKAMSDLIFAGSSKYSPASFAEVTLVLANENGKHIHVNNQVIKPDEIHLTRKLFRNGETEYRINGSMARLKDIHEVFMDTGAGAKSYSIIAQGEINKLVQAKPEERRVMIEEVAGITKFKIRKKESLKKIELTQSNLHRLSDLQTEIYKNLKALEKQAEKAEKARTLKDKIKRNELIIDSHREYDNLWDFKEGSTRLIQEKEELEQLQIKRNHLEVTLSDERLRKDELLSEVNDQQEEYNLLSKKLAQGEERLNYLKKSLKDKEHQIELRNKEKAEIKTDIEVATDRSMKWEEELEILKSSNPETMDLSSLIEKVELLKDQVSSKEQEMAEYRLQNDKNQRDLQLTEQQIFQNTRRLEDYVQSLQDINAEVEELEKNSSNFSDELITQREKLSSTKKSYDELKTTYEMCKKSCGELEIEISGLDKESRDLSKEVVKVDSRRQSLIELNESAADLQDGTSDFLKENNDQGFKLFGQVLKSNPDYITAIEHLMKDYFETLISKNGLEIASLKEWFKDSSKGGLSLTWKNLNGYISDEQLLTDSWGRLTPISEVLQFIDSDFEDSFKGIFAGFYIAENLELESISKYSGELMFRGIISKDGSTLIRNNSGIISVVKLSQTGDTTGIVQRNNLISDLEEIWDEKRSLLEVNEKILAQLRENQVEQKEKMLEVQKEMDAAYTAYISLKSALESREGNFHTGASRLELLKNRKSDISKNRLDLQEKEEVLAKDKENLTNKIASVSEQAEELSDILLDYKSNYDQEREELMRLQLLAKSYDTQLKSMQRQIEDANSQVERHQQRQDLINELVEKYCDDMELAEVETEQLAEDNKNKANDLGEREESLNLYKDQLSQLLLGMQERETLVKDITQRINKIEKSLVEVELKMKKIIEDEEILVRNCFDQYRIDLRSVLSAFLEISKESLSMLNNIDSMYVMNSAEGDIEIERVAYEFNKKYPGELKEAKEKYKDYKQELARLGEINWQAIEDYDRQKLRYEFLKVQEEELKTSLMDLQKAIDHIDEKCKIRFEEAYEAVNIRFQKVFPIIFGGGVACLQQTIGNGEDQEAGVEIIAQPPGKKMQNINLMSGGEKAMTAVSLIFSIFLVKPSPFCLLDEVDAPLDDANVGRFNELLREMSEDSQFIVITHNKKTMELNDTLYGITMQEPGVSRAVSVQLQ